jgi:threonine dehydrogenase-like Zn-dependent dehydrogenase
MRSHAAKAGGGGGGVFMRAALYYGPKDVRVEEIPDPVCGKSDIILKTVRTGICGSDVTGYFVDGGLVGIDSGAQFGHEIAARVVELGSEVQGIRIGDKVFPHPHFSIEPGKQDMLGGFSEFVRIPNAEVNKSIYILPDTLSYDESALIEAMGVGIRGKNRPQAKPGDHVVVYGAGFIGISCVASLIETGIVPVVIVRHNARREFLEKLGAIVCNINEVDMMEFLKETFGTTLTRLQFPAVDVDIVIDCAGGKNIPNEFLSMGKADSRLSVIAVPREDRPISNGLLMCNEAVIMGSNGYNYEDIIEVIGILERKVSPMTELITHHFKLDQINEAFEIAGDNSKSIKVIIDME